MQNYPWSFWSRNIIVTVWKLFVILFFFFSLFFLLSRVLSAIVSNAGLENGASHHPRHCLFDGIRKIARHLVAAFSWNPIDNNNNTYPIKSLPELRCVSTPEHTCTVTKQTPTKMFKLENMTFWWQSCIRLKLTVTGCLDKLWWWCCNDMNIESSAYWLWITIGDNLTN